MQFLTVRNFEKFNHYGTARRPVWIKLYLELLEHYGFTRLPDAHKAHVVGLFLLAARYQNRIPYDLGWLTTQLSATEPLDVEELVIAGFVTICDASELLAEKPKSASKLLEHSRVYARKSASADKKRGEERRTEEKKPPRKRAARAADGPPAGETPPPAPAHFLAPAAVAWEARNGVGSFPWGQAGKALKPLATAHPSDVIAAHLTRYLEATDARFVSLAKFAQTFGQWAPDPTFVLPPDADYLAIIDAHTGGASDPTNGRRW